MKVDPVRGRLPVLIAITIAGLLLLSACARAYPGRSAEPAAEERFDAQDFSEPTKITNPYYPLVPGTKFIFEGQKGNIPTRVETLVTNETKVVNGVTTVVILDKVFEAGQLVEETADWFAQDKRGNVWYFGEYATEYQNGRVKGHEGSWEAGVKDARPGIVMPASPQIGRAYRQEYAPRVAEDMAKVIKLGDSLCVPFRCFQGNVLVTEDWSPLEQGEVVNKYYASGVGLIRSVTIKGEPEKLDLVAVQRIN